MKKAVLILCCLMFAMFFPLQAGAEEDEFKKITDEISSELQSVIDGDTADVLEKQGVSVEDPVSVTNIKPEGVISGLWESFKSFLKKPIVMLGRILAVSIICAAVKGMSTDGVLNEVFDLIAVLSVIIIMTDTISESFEQLRSSVERINNFMTAYIPIFSSVVAAGGNAVTSGGYTAVMLFICEGMALIASEILVPFLSVVLGITLVSAVNPNLRFTGVADSVKKCTVWILSSVMTVFVGLVAIQGLTGAAADNLAVKTVKFAASSFIPVIGGSISEAYSAVRGSMGIIRSGIGSLGIIIVFIIAIKPILSVIAIKLTVWLGRIANDIFGENEISRFLQSANSVLSIGLAIVIAYAVVFIIATAVLMSAAAGG